MRLLTVLIIFLTIVPGVAAQDTPRSESNTVADVRHFSVSPDAAHPTGPVEPRHEERADDQVRDAAAPESAVLDAAFWRQVLAGVIVAVLSTLILRAIL